jgi:hypothetical protein
MVSPFAPLMSIRLIAIAVITLVVMGMGLMAGALMTEKHFPVSQSSSFEIPRGLTPIAPKNFVGW